MKDHEDDRSRDRGRLERGVRRSRSPNSSTPRVLLELKKRALSGESGRKRSREGRRIPSPSRDSVRASNRDRELFKPRIEPSSTDKLQHSIHRHARTKLRESRDRSRSRSRSRSFSPHSRRASSRSPSRRDRPSGSVPHLERKRAAGYHSEPRRRYPDSDTFKFNRSPKHTHTNSSSKRHRSPQRSPDRPAKYRSLSGRTSRIDRADHRQPLLDRRTPELDRSRPRSLSPRESRDSRPPRLSSPRLDQLRNRSRKRTSQPPSPDSRPLKARRVSPSATGANSIKVKSGDMAGRGYYGGYNPNQQMQAAFPHQDPRYSHSPVSSSLSPAPYPGGRGASWNGHQQSYSPTYIQPGYSPPSRPQGPYGNQTPLPSHSGLNHFRGNTRGDRGNNFIPRGGRGGRGGHYSNLHWNARGNHGGAVRAQYSHSGNLTPRHVSSQQKQFPNSSTSAPQHIAAQDAIAADSNEDLFRPSKDLQVEDKQDSKNGDFEKMPPPNRPPPSGPQSQQSSSRFSFAFKAALKTAPTPPKPEISQKLNAAPQRQPAQQLSPERPRNPAPTRNIPTEPASSRNRPDIRPPLAPVASKGCKVKKKMKREKPRPTLPDELRDSESVYYRKKGDKSVVGSGTYGKVFKGMHVYLKNLVALKKIRMEGERDGFPVTAVREIKLLQSLKHENIVHMSEVMVEKNDCFMVFEYLSHDLTGLLNHPNFKLAPAHKKHLAKQLFEGLDYLHKKSVLHRDIKAANILVSNDGQLKLADFGLARFYAKRKQQDYTNRVITIWYRPPELLFGETQYGPEVDIWSAACVLVEIFTRHAIFPGDGGEINQLEKIYAVLGTPNRVDWPRLSEVAWYELLRPSYKRPNLFGEKYKERVTPAAFELLEAMFQYDPVKRPSASDVLEHPYFTVEEPKPKQAVELQDLEGDWHEFESKALRKENERKDKEARRAAQKAKDQTAKTEKPSGKEQDEGKEKEGAKRMPSDTPVDMDREVKKVALSDSRED